MPKTEKVDSRKYLNPEILSKLSSMELRARLVVEGFITGLHKSPYHGFSVEFAEHRQYMPGDDIKHIDWKVYGKTDRFSIRFTISDWAHATFRRWLRLMICMAGWQLTTAAENGSGCG